MATTQHHRANRSLSTSTKLNDVQPKLFRAARQDDHRVCDYRGSLFKSLADANVDQTSR